MSQERGGTSETRRGRFQAWRLVEICALSTFAILVNFFPQKVGIYGSALDPDNFVPLLAPGFERHLPYLNAFFVLAILLAAAKLARGRPGAILNWADLALKALGIYVLTRFVSGGGIVGLNPAWTSVDTDSTRHSLARLLPWLNLALKMGLGVSLLALIVVAWHKLTHLLPQDRTGTERTG
ncbi:MAG: hypothetical protein PVF47_02015 [Anaerolineae bacterium]|jgi:hypothetical protein